MYTNELSDRTLNLIVLTEQRLIPRNAVKIYLYLHSRMNSKSQACFPTIKTICQAVSHCSQTVRNILHKLQDFNFINIEQRYRADGGKSSNNYFLNTDEKLIGTTYEYTDSEDIINNNNFNKNIEKINSVDESKKEDTKKYSNLKKELIELGCFPSLVNKALDVSGKITKSILEAFKKTNKTTFSFEKYKPSLFGAIKMVSNNAKVEAIATKYAFSSEIAEPLDRYQLKLKSESMVEIPIEFKTRKEAKEYVEDYFGWDEREMNKDLAVEKWLNANLIEIEPE